MRITSILPAFLLLVSATPALAQAIDWQPSAEGPLWSPQLFLTAEAGTDRSIGSVELTVPLTQQEHSLLFVDGRVSFDTDDQAEGSFGLGYRFELNLDAILGFYAFAEAVRSENDNYFYQGVFGTELLMEDWQARANFYLPDDSTEDIGTVYEGDVRVVGNEFLLEGTNFEEGLMTGGDIEVGRRIWERRDIWAYVGYFYFDDSGFEEVHGPRIRGEWIFDTDDLIGGSYMTLSGEWRHDDLRGSEAFAGLQMRIPLGGTSGKRVSAYRRMQWRYWAMQERIRRDQDMLVGIKETPVIKPAVNAATGEEYDAIYFAAAGGNAGARGTMGDPFDIDTAAGLAGPNVIVVALDRAGNITTSGIVLPTGSTLVGGGASLRVGTELGARAGSPRQELLQVTLPGTPATIESTGDYVIRLADNARNITVHSLQLEGSNVAALSGLNNRRITVQNLAINETGAAAIEITNGEQIFIDSINITDTGGQAVTLTNFNESTFSNFTIREANGGGVLLQNSTEAAVTDFDIATASGDAMTIADSTDLDITWFGNDRRNVLLSEAGAALRVTGSTFERGDFGTLTSNNSADNGVLLEAVGGTMRVFGPTTVNDSTGASVAVQQISEDDANIQFAGITVTSPDAQGVLVQNISGEAARVTLGSTTVSLSTQEGVLIDDISGERARVSLGSTSVTTPTTQGVEINNVTGTGASVSLTSTRVTDAVGQDAVLVNNLNGDNITVSTGSVNVRNAARGVVVSTIAGLSPDVNVGSVTLNDITGDGVFVDALGGTDPSVNIGTVTAQSDVSSGDAVVHIAGITGTSANVSVGAVRANDAALPAQHAVLIDAITVADVTLEFSTVNATGTTDTGVLVNGPTGANARITFGNLTFNSLPEGLRVTQATGNNFTFVTGAITGNDVDDDLATFQGSTGADSIFRLGNIVQLQTPVANTIGRGLVLNGDFGTDTNFDVGNITMRNTQDEGVALLNISGSGFNFDMGTFNITNPGNEGIEISNFTADNSSIESTGGTIITNAAGTGILIDTVTGANAEIDFGVTTVEQANGDPVTNEVVTQGTIDADVTIDIPPYVDIAP